MGLSELPPSNQIGRPGVHFERLPYECGHCRQELRRLSFEDHQAPEGCLVVLLESLKQIRQHGEGHKHWMLLRSPPGQGRQGCIASYIAKSSYHCGSTPMAVETRGTVEAGQGDLGAWPKGL